MTLRVDERVPGVLKSFKLPNPIGFGTTLAPVMITCDFKQGEWGTPELIPYGPVSLSPTAKVFHYGQEIFEGMKAYRVKGKGPYLFRPLENQKRFNFSAERTAMPKIPESLFMKALFSLTEAVAPFIPSEWRLPLSKAFYDGNGRKPWNRPSKEFKFLVVASPSACYFKKGKTFKCLY